MTPRPVVTMSFLYLVLLGLSTWHLGAWAQDGDMQVQDEGDAQESEAQVEQDAAAAPKVEQDVPAASEPDAMERAEKYLNSAQELTEKLGLLQKLLDAKGEEVDPELKASVQGLKERLASLGLSMGSAQDQLQSLMDADGGSKDVGQLVSACLAMSVHRAGARRLSTLDGIRRLASAGLEPKEAAGMELARLFAVCINDISEHELDELKAGKSKPLSKALANKAATEGEALVLKLPKATFTQLRAAAKEFQKSLAPPDQSVGSLMKYGWLAAIPFALMVAYFVKTFSSINQDKQKREEAKQAKAAKKKH